MARDDIAALLEGVGVETQRHSARPASLAQPRPEGFELVQFTSGSTGPPRGVALDGDTIATNVVAILDRLRPRPGDVTVSWLPLSHDMGLIGMLLASIVAFGPRWVDGGTVVLMEPEQFLRAPGLWLETLARWEGTFTAAPDFGYRIVTERQTRETLDLSRVRCAIVGGEVVRASTLRVFCDAWRQSGLEENALCPAYGMAEIGLAATLTSPSQHWSEEELDLDSLADHIRSPPTDGARRTTLVGSGVPLGGYDVAVSSNPDAIGPVSLSAPAVGRHATEGRRLDDDGHLITGDVGFVDANRELYICGREDDHLVTHGRNLYAPAIEDAVSQLRSVRSGRVTAVGTHTGEWIIAAEPAARSPLGVEAVRRLEREIRRAAVAVAAARPAEVVIVRPGRLPMTNSGKVQRNLVRRCWLQGTLEVL